MTPDSLIEAIVRDPEADGNWLVYADFSARIRELEADEERLLSPRLVEQAHYWRFAWRRGFIHSAMLGGAADDPAGVEAVEALFADPHAALLDGLSLGRAGDDALVRAAMAAPRPSLRQMEISGAVDVGDRLDVGAPRLEHLVVVRPGIHVPDPQIDDLGGLQSLAHAQLRSLATWPSACRALCSGLVSLPSLEQLRWHCLRGDGDPLFAPGSILHAPPPRLHTLGLWRATGAIVDALAACPVHTQLRRLDIHNVSFDALERLCAGGFTGLARLAIESGPPSRRLAPADVDALRARVTADLPNTELAIAWDAFAERPSNEPRVTYDDQSRGPDGRIDAIGAATTRRPT